jgi:hypothetical protein
MTMKIKRWIETRCILGAEGTIFTKRGEGKGDTQMTLSLGLRYCWVDGDTIY